MPAPHHSVFTGRMCRCSANVKLCVVICRQRLAGVETGRSSLHSPLPPLPSDHCEQCMRPHWCAARQRALCNSCRQMRDMVEHAHCSDARHMHGASPCCHHLCAECTTQARVGSRVYYPDYVQHAAGTQTGPFHSELSA